MNSAYRDRMMARLEVMEQRVTTPVADTFSLFEATRVQRDELEAQRRDAIAWANELEEGTESEEALAEGLTDYARALETALDPHAQAPHYRSIHAGLENKLEPEQLDTVLADARMDKARDASMENALYSGREVLVTGHPSEHPWIYREHHQAWVHDNAAVVLDGQPVDYQPAREVSEAVTEVLTDEQRILQDQRAIDAGLLAGQPQLAEALGVSRMDFHAQQLYGAPMIDDGPLAPASPEPSVPAAPETAVQVSPEVSNGPEIT